MIGISKSYSCIKKVKWKKDVAQFLYCAFVPIPWLLHTYNTDLFGGGTARCSCHLSTYRALLPPHPCPPCICSIILGTGPGSLWAATLGCHLQAPKHFPRAVAEGPGLPGVDWLPGVLDSGQQCVSPGSKPPDHSDPLLASGTWKSPLCHKLMGRSQRADSWASSQTHTDRQAHTS